MKPLYIYVTDKLEIGATSDYKELPTANHLIVHKEEKEIEELLTN